MHNEYLLYGITYMVELNSYENRINMNTKFAVSQAPSLPAEILLAAPEAGLWE